MRSKILAIALIPMAVVFLLRTTVRAQDPQTQAPPAAQPPADQPPVAQPPAPDQPPTPDQPPAPDQPAAPAPGAQSTPDQPKSVLDGIYTQDQAQRGSALYSDACASCHGPELTGGEMAPPLIGGDFLADWDGLTVGDLFERMRISMPQNSPGSLSAQQNADILAFVLSANKYPVGTTELPKESMILKMIKFEVKQQ